MVEHISRGTTLTIQKFRRLAFQQLKRKKVDDKFLAGTAIYFTGLV